MLHDGETKADAAVVGLSCALELSKAGEQAFEILFFDAHSLVLNLDRQHVGRLSLVVDENLDQGAFSFRSELDRIFEQVNEHLPEADLVAEQALRQTSVRDL